jgi:hypothetical protein
MTAWPFTNAQLTAGLRRYFADSSIRLRSFGEAPLTAGAEGNYATVRGLRVEYDSGGPALSVECVVKEPRGVSRPGLAGGGLREVGVYRSLAPQLPMQTPALIAADNAGSWMVLEAVAVDIPLEKWSADDYRRAVKTLADLHERFWGLSDDLAVYPWLSRPLANDFEIYVYAAVSAMEKMMRDNLHQLITGSLETLTGLGQILTQVERMAERLRAAPHTLLHGDFRPANIALQEAEEMVVFDWQLVGVGPGMLDLIAFVNACRWERADLPVAPDELIQLYRGEMALRVGAQWSDDEWAELMDHALMWRFIQEMLGWVANASPETFAMHEARFRDIWLGPVLEATNRRLRPVLYL